MSLPSRPIMKLKKLAILRINEIILTAESLADSSAVNVGVFKRLGGKRPRVKIIQISLKRLQDNRLLFIYIIIKFITDAR